MWVGPSAGLPWVAQSPPQRHRTAPAQRHRTSKGSRKRERRCKTVRDTKRAVRGGGGGVGPDAVLPPKHSPFLTSGSPDLTGPPFGRPREGQRMAIGQWAPPAADENTIPWLLTKTPSPSHNRNPDKHRPSASATFHKAGRQSAVHGPPHFAASDTPPPPPPPAYRDVWCAGHRWRAHVRHNKRLVSGTIGAFRLEKIDTQPPPPPRNALE